MLHQPDTDVIFPPRAIQKMRDLRGKEWKDLIDHLLLLKDETHPDILAFSLMMIRLCSCLTCQPDSYRAMRGCTTCSTQVINRFKGTDIELIQRWKEVRHELSIRLGFELSDEKSAKVSP